MCQKTIFFNKQTLFSASKLPSPCFWSLPDRRAEIFLFLYRREFFFAALSFAETWRLRSIQCGVHKNTLQLLLASYLQLYLQES